MKSEFDIETLSAYLDGELDSARAAEVKKALLRDPALRQEMERLNAPVEAVKQALSEIDVQPIPASLQALLDENEAPPEKVQWPSLAAAASVALVIGAIAGLWGGGGLVTESGPQSPWQAVRHPAALQLLDTLASAEEAVVDASDGTLLVRPVLTFVNDSGALCRQYTVESSQSDDAADAVACRRGSAQWVVEVATSRSAPGAEQAEPNYVPASGARVGFNRVVDSLIEQPVDPERERELIQSNWQSIR